MAGLLENGFGFGGKKPQTSGPSPEGRSFGDGRPCITGLIRQAAEPLPPDFGAPAFARMFDRFAESKIVLLGASTHGTSEFHRARAAITHRLIEQHGFSILALDADAPEAARLDRLSRGESKDAEAAAAPFPGWMWRNAEIAGFIDAMRVMNQQRPQTAPAGIHGLDRYSLHASMRAVVDYLNGIDPRAARVATERFGCLAPWASRPQSCNGLALSGNYHTCEDGVLDALTALLERQSAPADLIETAPAYYRTLYYGAAQSWNLRTRHLFETLETLLDAQGPDAKAVVWAHNAQVGDASATEMGREKSELSLGQLCRARFGADAVSLIGLGSDRGEVACASEWGGPVQVKRLRGGMTGSFEQITHTAAVGHCLLDLRPGVHPALRHALAAPRLERFIGAVYRPENERWSHYAGAALSEQFDAYAWFDETTALTALDA